MASHTDWSLPAQEVLEAARDCLRKSSSTVVRAVSCDYDQGVLVLRGRVPSFYCKQLAQEAVARVAAGVEVANVIEVDALR